MKKKAVLTGATGFIGASTIAPLLEHFQVLAVCRQIPENRVKNVEYRTLDLEDANAVIAFFQKEKPTHLIHTAWTRAGSGGLWDSPMNDHWVDLSETLVKIFHQSGGKRVVVCGTCAEYANSDTPLCEDTSQVKPNSPYGAAKVELYRRLEAFASKSGLSLAWPRLFFIYGPGESPNRLVPSVINNLLTGNEALCSHGNQVRDYAYVEDIGEGLVKLLNSQFKGPVNLATGQKISLRHIIEEIGVLTSRSGLIRLGALPARDNETPIIVGATKRLEHILGWRPKTDLKHGLTKTIELAKKMKVNSKNI